MKGSLGFQGGFEAAMCSAGGGVQASALRDLKPHAHELIAKS